MLNAVLKKFPSVFPLAHCTYSTLSYLYFGQKCVIISSEGVQQGDPLGSLLFCLTTLEIVKAIKSEFCDFYIDDTTLGVLQNRADLALVEEEAMTLGLKLNHTKSELIGISKDSIDRIMSSFSSFKVIKPCRGCHSPWVPHWGLARFGCNRWVQDRQTLSLR